MHMSGNYGLGVEHLIFLAIIVAVLAGLPCAAIGWAIGHFLF